MKAAGIIVCIGCRQRLDLESLDDCSCSYITEAEVGELLSDRDRAIAAGRCRRCDQERPLQEHGLGAGLCDECVEELAAWIR